MPILLSKFPKLLGGMNHIHKSITEVRISHRRSEYPAYSDALIS